MSLTLPVTLLPLPSPCHVPVSNCAVSDTACQVFDTAFEDHKKLKTLLKEYQIPVCFQADLFNYISDDERPPNKWIVMGPPRAGTGVSVDPLGTCSWHTLLSGKRRWILAPASTPSHVMKPKQKLLLPDYVGGAAQWFAQVYPSLSESLDAAGVIELTQHAGETLFVPAGWQQVVMNLEFSIAITHNFASEQNLPRIVVLVNDRREDMIEEWLEGLEEHQPELQQQVELLLSQLN